MIHALTDFAFLVMLFFFENQIFFSTHVESSPKPHVLPSFDEVSTTFERFKPGFVYKRRQRPILQPFELDPPFEPVQTTSSTNNQISHAIHRRSTRITRPPDRYGFSHTSLHTTLTTVPIPSCYSEAAKHDCWRKAMEEELQALVDNHTWDIVHCPANVKAIGCK